MYILKIAQRINIPQNPIFTIPITVPKIESAVFNMYIPKAKSNIESPNTFINFFIFSKFL